MRMTPVLLKLPAALLSRWVDCTVAKQKAGREDKERYGKAVVGCTIGFWVPLRVYVHAARTVGGANEGDSKLWTQRIWRVLRDTLDVDDNGEVKKSRDVDCNWLALPQRYISTDLPGEPLIYHPAT
ncbi:hypothetical protein B0H14DRAFT_2613618 [Mycena olivaceomarginata]|nr:hypothetical protein B0H14DRAFT_2613618 [Mycena olivaceomarginata]